MVNRENRISLYFAMTLLALLLSGCAGTVKNMRLVPPDKIIASPEEGKAMVVFMRPSSLGAAIQSSVFEVRGDNLTLVGIVAAKKKVAYQLQAGNHLFMVVGESADYMSAELEPNKTYYALVAPRMGVWKARFSLKPVSSEQLNSSQFSEWYENCEWVENTPDSYNWASSNMTSIQAKHKKYYPKWMEKDLADRPKLLLQDGK